MAHAVQLIVCAGLQHLYLLALFHHAIDHANDHDNAHIGVVIGVDQRCFQRFVRVSG